MNEHVHAFNCALEAAVVAGDIMRQSRITGLHIQDKGQSHNLVTQADKNAETAIVSIIRKTFPLDDILAEEHDWGTSGSSRVWVIDPIDGTTNFIRNIPQYACSIALCIDGKPVVGVVHAPATGETFWAIRGQGAWLRLGSSKDIRLQASSETDIANAMFITGFYYDRDACMQATLNCLGELMRRNCLATRRLGAASIDLCMVAAGRAEGYWEHELNPWDYAAGWIICEEAGATVTRMDTSALSLQAGSVLAVCKGQRTLLQQIIAEQFKDTALLH